MIKMNNKYKIILNYIQDLSVEIPTPEALITSRNNIGKYEIKVNISSKPLKLKMVEVVTKLTYTDPRDNKHKAYFEIQYATVIDILDPDAIVLGGGLSNIPFLYEEGKNSVYKKVFSDQIDTPILKNKLGDSAGVFGACIIWLFIEVQ